MVRRRSSPGSSSTTRIRALRLPVWFKIVFLAYGLPPRVTGFALIQRALDVGDGVELSACLLEVLAQPGVLIQLGLQTVIGVRRALPVGPDNIRLQPALVPL